MGYKGTAVRIHSFMNVGYSPNYGPLVDIDYITPPNTKGHQSGTLTLGTTHVAEDLNV